MNGFHDFDDFRVSAWMNEGLMIRLADTAKSITNNLKKAACTVVVAVSVAIAASATVPAAASVPSVENAAVQFSFETLNPLDFELAQMSQLIESQMDSLLDFSGIGSDAATLSLANEALAAIASRNGAAPRDWATKIFPSEH